jgi:capsular exopolysaccharide synthesis family protein
MGKLYEALKRADGESDETEIPFGEIRDLELDDWSTEGFNSDRSIDGLEQSSFNEQQSGRFNFLRYSLGEHWTLKRDVIKRDPAAAAMVRRSPAQPNREVNIDPSQIDPHLVFFHNIDPAASAQYNKLALTLISRAAESGVRRVLVTSAQRGEGRTSVTLNLACALASARRRVLVVDCDLLNPGVTRLLGINCEAGMAEAFFGRIEPAAAAIRVQPYGFNILPASKRIENPVELLGAPGFWKMMQMFDAGYDFVLFDSSPFLAMGDASLLVRFMDTTLLVVQQGRTSSSQMAKAISPFSQEDLLGVVINRAQK